MRFTTITAALSLAAVAFAAPVPAPGPNAELETRGLGDFVSKGLRLVNKSLGKSDDTVSRGGGTTFNPGGWKNKPQQLPRPPGNSQPGLPSHPLPQPPVKPSYPLPKPPQ